MNEHGQKLVVRCMFISIDGFAAGRNQCLERPFGDNVEGFQDWVFATRTGRQMIGQPGGEEGIDDAYLAEATNNIGATIIGRNMFGPSRGEWIDDGWTGWWGPNPPYHNDVYILTHHARASMPMEGGTTFHFVTEGIGAALDRAFATADGKDVRLVGGPATVGQYLQAGLVDEMHLVMVPMLVGAGERLLDDPATAANYRCVKRVESAAVSHLHFERAIGS